MARLTTAYKNSLNNMNTAAQRAALGTRIDSLEYGSVATPASGTLTPAPIMIYATTPAIGSATATHAAVGLLVAAQDVTTGITQPDFPRIVTIKGNGANVAGNVVITGTDIAGNAITDTIAASGSSEVLGTKAFATITNIHLPAYAVADTETISIGRGNKIGIPTRIKNTAQVLIKNFDGAADSGTVTAGASVSQSIFAPNGTMNGTKILELYFVE